MLVVTMSAKAGEDLENDFDNVLRIQVQLAQLPQQFDAGRVLRVALCRGQDIGTLLWILKKVRRWW